MLLILSRSSERTAFGGIEQILRTYKSIWCARGLGLMHMFTTSGPHNISVNEFSYQGLRVSGNILSLKYVLDAIRRAQNASYVNIHMPFILGMVSALFIDKRKLVINWHSDIENKGLIGLLLRPLERLIAKRALRIIVTNLRVAQNSKILKHHLAKTIVVPVCVSANTQNFRSFSERHGILFLGRFSEYKGIRNLIELYQRHWQILPQLTIVGCGELSEQVRAFAKAFPEKVIFFDGHCSELEKQEFFLKSRAFVFPSTNSAETFGIIQLEALSAGLPVVNTFLGTSVETVSVNGRTGLTVPPNNIDALRDALMAIHEQPELFSLFSANAKRHVTQYNSQEAVSRALYKAFEGLVD